MYKLDQPSLLFESSRPGRSTAILPESDVPDQPLSSLIPARTCLPRRSPCRSWASWTLSATIRTC